MTKIPDDFPTADNPPSYTPTGEINLLSPLAERWPCRRCGVDVTVSDDAVHSLNCQNRILAKRKERLIERNEVVLCDACRERHETEVAEYYAARDVKMRLAFERLSDPTTPTHVLGELESYVRKHANSGNDLVNHYKDVRKRATSTRAKGAI